MRTRLCDLFDISQPIIGAPFGPWNSVKLAAAICESGGLGSLGTAVRPVEQLKEQWAQLCELTDRPFAINHQPRPFSPEAFEATLEARPAVISYHRAIQVSLSIELTSLAACGWRGHGSRSGTSCCRHAEPTSSSPTVARRAPCSSSSISSLCPTCSLLSRCVRRIHASTGCRRAIQRNDRQGDDCRPGRSSDVQVGELGHAGCL
jgi:NAD(P)H-dependent flavin oxidoreductase YrpB (nitropropane dioxygenase family)